MKPLTAPRHPGHILVADDDEPFRMSTVRYLRAQGFGVEGVADGPAAMAMLEAREFDLLISDIAMPGNESLELVRQVSNGMPWLPVILMTGFPTVETAVQSLNLPVAGYLMKPPRLDELLVLARRSIANGRALRSLDSHRERLQGWCENLDEIRTALRSPSPGTEAMEPQWAYLTLSINQIIESLFDLKAFAEHLVQPQPASLVTQRLESSRPLVLLEAIRDTIGVLEKTKSSFKSRELGELRIRLEQLVQGTRPEPGRGPVPSPPAAGTPGP